MSRLLGRVRRKMLAEGLPAVLNDLDEQRATEARKPAPLERLRAQSPASAMRDALLRPGCLAIWRTER
jgi:hypothetical protein